MSSDGDSIISPAPTVPEAAWEHRQLYDDVLKTLYALPSYFRTDLRISGVLATDLFTFNSSLGATIEAQVVEALNGIRGSWDPDQRYAAYSFVRQAQRFPDVILRTSAVDIQPPILLGIELKGWYALAKEREPSFRYRVSPSVCAPADLLVVYPWALSGVISGSLLLYQPFVVGARYAAEYRNYWWQHIKEGGPRNALKLSTVDHSLVSAKLADEHRQTQEHLLLLIEIKLRQSVAKAQNRPYFAKLPRYCLNGQMPISSLN